MTAILAHGAPPPRPTMPELLLTWNLDAVLVVGWAAAAAALYVWGIRRWSGNHPERPFPRRRIVAFGAGLTALLVALASPVSTYADALFSVHMAQHLLLLFVAAPLLLAGTPVALARGALPPRGRRRLSALLRSDAVATLTHPVVTWAVLIAALYATHFTGLYDAALELPWVHDLEHVLYLAAGLLFWHPVLAAEPSRHRLGHGGRLLYVFLTVPANAFLGVALYGAARAYPHYETLERSWGPSALADQQAGGLLMWVVGGLGMLVAVLAVAGSWARTERRGLSSRSPA